MAIGRAARLEEETQTPQVLLGIDHAGGVVGGVDEHRLGLQVHLEILQAGGNGDQRPPCALHKNLIFREVGGEGEEFIPRTAQG